jgi:hypothetical protein
LDDSILSKLRNPLIYGKYQIHFTNQYHFVLENQEWRRNFKNNHIIPWDHWLAKADPYYPMCKTTKSQAEEARAEAVLIEQFRHLSTSGMLIPGGSGNGQDPDDNRGPPKKQLPEDKIGSNNNSDDDNEEKKKKKRKKDDDSDKSRLVRFTTVAVRNINQVSTLIFFSFLSLN